MNQPTYELAVVMPVYNEEGCIAEVVQSWRTLLSAQSFRFLLLVLNDGSTDRTAQILGQFEKGADVLVVHKMNSGHGPTILEGYRRAVALAEWVFQCDSDNEIEPSHFLQLWEQRHHVVAVFGYRIQRSQTWVRFLFSQVAKKVINGLFGNQVRDVNIPYRLIRSGFLQEVVNQIPPQTFAPNLLISGSLSLSGVPVVNVPVPFQTRRTGQVSIVKWKLWKAGMVALIQLVRWRFKGKLVKTKIG